MIATIHTFGRDLKWNPHIHCLIPELIYSFKKIKSKHFIISILRSLEKLFSLNEFDSYRKLED
ncbi:transposase [Holdemanella porci]|uniref:transposase n=1 Tax=Holdemanella porci TaxID=2652276 RepID=UPI003A52315B